MSSDENSKTDKSFGLPWWLILVVSLILIAAIICVFLYALETIVSNNPAAQLGPMGDFVGGTLNPIFAFISFLALLFTINVQLKALNVSREELRLTREEVRLTRDELAKSAVALESQTETSKRQRFENTLFNMISLLNQILSEMDVSYRDRGHSGRDCFLVFIDRLKLTYNRWGRVPINSDQLWQGDKENKNHNRDRIDQSYETFYSEYSREIGHYFRVLFNIFRYLDESDIKDDIYSKIIRAQLSEQELLIIFYNAISARGHPLTQYAEKYALFDNLDTTRLFRAEHIDMVPKAAFGANLCIPPKHKADDIWTDD